MKRGQEVRSEKSRRNRGRTAAPQGLAAHRAFAPLLGLWGVLLGALPVLVLPAASVQGALEGTLMGTWGETAQPAMAAIAAALLGLPLFAFAAEMHSRARRRSDAPTGFDLALRQRVTPINPARDLGGESLDDPIEAMPFASPAWRDADFDASPSTPVPEEIAATTGAGTPGGPHDGHLHAHEAASESGPMPQPMPPTVPEPEPEGEPEPGPVALDLAAFAELPDAAPQDPVPAAAQPDPVAAIRSRRLRAVAPLAPAPGTAALARLRAQPTSELSLVEMVERFAGALHEHLETPPLRPRSAADLAGREAALTEALKALAALTGGPVATPAHMPADEPLRAALAQLQPRRGAA